MHISFRGTINAGHIVCAKFCAFPRIWEMNLERHVCITLICSETDVMCVLWCFIARCPSTKQCFLLHSLCRSTTTTTTSPMDKLQKQTSIVPCTGSSTDLDKRVLRPVQPLKHSNAQLDYLCEE